MDPTSTTPYSTVRLLIGRDMPQWVEEMEAERIGSYAAYENLYWSNPNTLRMLVRGDEEDQPIYLPTPREIVDTTAHFLLKGLRIGLDGDVDKTGKVTEALKAFLKREKFYSKFQVAKHSGVTRGDYVLHMTADDTLPEGRRISLNSVDPAMYFPIYDPDDIDRIIGVQLVDQFESLVDQKTYIKRLVYMKEGTPEAPTITVEEALWEVKDWWVKEKAVKVRQLKPKTTLDPEITSIPVYHIKNIEWQGWPYGASELKGYERVFGGLDQTITDEELALALEGLGVYATDGGPPQDENGDDTDWVIAPAKVMQVPQGGFFKRVEGVGSVKPMLDHANFLEDSLMRASGTFQASRVEAAVAESGVALSIKFLPMQAKIEQRELAAQDELAHLFWDWKIWHKVFEGQDLGEEEIVAHLGSKLPTNRVETLNELNNFLDRRIISKKYYREQVKLRLGYEIPEDIDKEIEAEVKAQQDLDTPEELLDENGNNIGRGNGADGDKGGRPPTNQPPGNQRPGSRSNNKSRPNESNGTEAKQGAG